MYRSFFACLLASGAGQVLASQPAYWDLLQKAANAGRSQPVSGTYIHFADDDQETFRLYRMNAGNKVHEKRLSLDGVSRELVRKDNELIAYAPETKSLVAADLGASKLFPAILPERTLDLQEAYVLTSAGVDRVAGRDCHWLQLNAKQAAQRYGLKLCIDIKTALPLKSMTHDAKGRVLEQFAFTDVQLSAPKEASVLRPQYKYSLMLGAAVAVRSDAAVMLDVKGMPAGFRMLRYVERQLAGHEHPAMQFIYSDGLAKLSLFVEPGKAGARPVIEGPAGVGVVSRPLGDKVLTLVGDMPKQGLEATIAAIRIDKK